MAATGAGGNAKSIRDWLTSYLAAVPGLPPGSFAYRGIEDFVLRHGQPHAAQPLPVGYRLGAFRECFDNSRKLAVRHGIRYVEGFAVPQDVSVPIHHAWCISEDNAVVDVTWGTPGESYFGVVLPLDLVIATSRAPMRGKGVLDDWPNGWPILRKPFVPKDEGRRARQRSRK